MQLKFAAALFASSLAAMALAGDTGIGAGSVDSLLGAVLDRGAPARDRFSKFSSPSSAS
ncbi:hypothetical protein SCHPADRAFT_906542 [Schizopora paradoxa]|uniref:Uncharacterized protein n=1 Tax=Schizopora paradoxa TaxID=27342 RepID=A0A0H2RMY5_9AGAM|nr:hypothetical protein SCHPADRAFT_906542 [Schizopora paradoxa]